jgi:hypothetical protein
MRAPMLALAASAALAATAARAHGPQIQITRDNDQITTRRILREEPYSARLTRPTTVYAIPLLETDGIWYSRPNNTPSATLPDVPEYISGPGIAYGYDQLDGGPPAFASGRRFELKLIDGLQWWNGAAFVDPGSEQVEAFRSSGAPAVTSDSLTPASPATLAYGNVSATYNSGAHSSASFRLLGDGASATVEGDDGIYLLSLIYASTEPSLNASEPFYFLLHKNAVAADIESAVGSLGVAPSFVQYVPEPSAAALFAIGVATLALRKRGRTPRRRSS